MLEAETTHREHAIVEQVIADLKSGPLAHLPSGKFAANSDWLVLAAIAFNLTRAGALAFGFPREGATTTIGAQLIAVPARLARSARRLRLHLPGGWPWEQDRARLFDATCGPPASPDPDHQPARPDRRPTAEVSDRPADHPAHAKPPRSIQRFTERPRSTVDRG